MRELFPSKWATNFKITPFRSDVIKDWLAQFYFGLPKAVSNYTSKELIAMGFVGLYWREE